jgi:hypothetical protein
MFKRNHIVAAALWGILLGAPPVAVADDPVSEWNQIAVTVMLGASPAQAPVVQGRTMAIVQVSVHDAISAITGQYDTYSAPGPAPAGALPEAAAIGAAYQALRGIFPLPQSPGLDGMFATSLAAHGFSDTDPGVLFGRAVASAILSQRATDGAALAQFDYIVPGAGQPGVWVRLNNAPALLPGWGNVTPFVLRSGSQFRPDAPYALTSEEWAKDYNEVLDIGEMNSQSRSQEQTDIALFWRGSPAAIWNPVIRQALAARDFDLASKARAFALMYMAANDSGIACWDAKYAYNFWRPMPAIRDGELDGNPGTLENDAWTPLLPTPPHPEYPSGHSTNSSAIGTVLTTLFGKDPGMTFTVTLTGITREWQTFDQGIDEVIEARIYSGIHYRASDVVGARLGRQVAHFVMTHALRPRTGSWK